MSGILFKQGEVILIPVPFADLQSTKQRPALIISNNSYNKKVDDILICGITSNINNDDYSVILGQDDMAEGSIHYLSRIRADKLFLVDKRHVKRKLGKVKKNIIVKTKKELVKLID